MRFKLVTVVMLGVLLTGCIGGVGQRADVGVFMTNSGMETEVSSSLLGALGVEVAETDQRIEEIWVTITGVAVKRDGNWEMLAVKQQEPIDLMGLRFSEMLLGEGKIPAGSYSEIRFQIAEEGNYVVVEGGETKPLKVPSDELKPHIGKLNIAAGTVTELVFDVNSKYFAEPGKDGGYNANPRQSLRFVEQVELEFGELDVRIELPEWLDEVFSIELSLFKVGELEPIWITELEEGELALKVSFLPPGEYYLEATVQLADFVTIQLSAGPFEVKVGEIVTPILEETEQ